MKRPERKRARPRGSRRLEIELVRFEIEPKPSGLYRHRTVKVILPVRPT